MNSNVNFEAAAGVLLFLGTSLLLLVLGVFTLQSLIVRRYGRMRWGICALLCVSGGYLGLMLLFSSKSEAKVLARGEEKYFCEIDCHLAYSVVDLKRAKTIGNPPHQATAGGNFYIITIRTRFDEHTISARRGNEPLTPNARVLTIFDESGRKYNLSDEGQKALAVAGDGGMPLTTPLRPGESYTTAFVFDVPAEVKQPTLLINEELLPTRFIIGHENSFRHGQTTFRLDPDASAPSLTVQLSHP